MFRLIHKNPSDPDRLHLAELQVQCALAKESYVHLSEYIDVVGRNNARGKPLPYSPLQIVAHCVVFLAAAAAISKILFPSKKGAESRGERLRSRLEVSDLPALRSRAVRNAYEHIDERIDALSSKQLQTNVSLIDMTTDRAGEPVVLKRLDPKRGTMEFLDQVLSIEDCYAEIKQVQAAL